MPVAPGRPSLLAILAGAAACSVAVPHAPRVPALEEPPRIVVLPFRTGGMMGRGGAFAPVDEGPQVPHEAGVRAAETLAAGLERGGLAVVPAASVAHATPPAGAVIYDVALARRVAEQLGANVGVLGAITRYDERQGSAWGVERPATVWYQVLAIRASDGAVLARDEFDYTQQPLSANLLDLPRVLDGGVGWRTREEILDSALGRSAARLARALPVAERGAAIPETDVP